MIPRSHADPAVLADKRRRLGEPHVAALNDLAARIEAAVGAAVPRFDPASGGINAQVLMLLETPSRAGTFGSGIISVDNDDTAAANLWRAHQATGLSREISVVWNAVPWYVGNELRIRPARAREVSRATPFLRDLLALLPRLCVLLALGRAAQRAVPALEAELTRRGVVVLAAPHPSQRVYNVAKQHARERVHAAFTEASRAIAG